VTERFVAVDDAVTKATGESSDTRSHPQTVSIAPVSSTVVFLSVGAVDRSIATMLLEVVFAS